MVFVLYFLNKENQGGLCLKIEQLCGFLVAKHSLANSKPAVVGPLLVGLTRQQVIQRNYTVYCSIAVLYEIRLGKINSKY